MINLLHKIIHLHARIEQTKETRKIILDYNRKDRGMMNLLCQAIEKMNKLKVTGPQGKRMVFSLKSM